MMRDFRFLGTFLLAISLIIDASGAQSPDSGAVTGIITDTQDFALPDVEITAINLENKKAYQATTDEDGKYRLVLPIGTYTLQFERSGFVITPCGNVQILAGQTVSVNKRMKPGGVHDTVTISGEHSVIDPVSSDNKSVLTGTALTELPLSGRSFASLAILIPGAALQPTFKDAKILVNGSSPSSVTVQVDGANSDASASILTNALPVDSIKEFSVWSQEQAESGGYSAARVGVVTRGGTDDFFISGSYDHRNSALGARDFFDKRKSPSRRHQFRASSGGPLVRGRSFLFGSYEGLRSLAARPRRVSVPTSQRLAQARSVLSAAGLVENSLSTRILNLFPSGESSEEFNNVTINSPDSNNSDSFIVRFDQNVGSANSFYSRYNFARTNRLFPSDRSFLNGFRTQYSNRDQSLFGNVTFVFAPRYINELRFSYSRNSEKGIPEDIDFDPSSLGLNTGVTEPDHFGLPLIKITGFEALGSSITLPFRRVGRLWQVVETFSYYSGTQSVKAGFDFRRASVKLRNDAGVRGRLSFDGSQLGDPLADFLGGLPSGNTGIVRGDTDRDYHNYSFNWFVQDSKRFTPNFTLNFGIRHEINSVIGESQNRLSNFIPHVGLVGVGSPELPRLYNKDLNNFGPRVGLNWDPSKSGFLSIKASWGMFFDTITPDLISRLGPFPNSVTSGVTINSTPPSPVIAIAPPLPIPYGPGVPIFGSTMPTSPFDLFAIDRDLKTPQYQKFFAGLEYEFHPQHVLEFQYVGTRGKQTFRAMDLNQPSPGDPNTRESRRPFHSVFPEFRTINTLVSSGRSSYDSLRVMLKRSFKDGVSFQANYTLANSIDEASLPAELPQDSRNLRAERGPSSFDQRHSFLAWWVYDFANLNYSLRGWQISGVVRFASGTPINPVLSFDNSGTGMFSDRPNQIGQARIGNQKTQLFTRTAFAIPAKGTLGTLGRNDLTGPGVNNFDFAVKRQFSLNEKFDLDIRIDLLNVYNHPNFQPPNMFVDDPAFGSVNATDPLTGRRSVQVGIRLYYH